MLKSLEDAGVVTRSVEDVPAQRALDEGVVRLGAAQFLEQRNVPAAEFRMPVHYLAVCLEERQRWYRFPRSRRRVHVVEFGFPRRSHAACSRCGFANSRYDPVI